MPDLFLVGGGNDRRRSPSLLPDTPPDAQQRALALDIRHSWIVEAPAGSGKTGLLLQRFLKLLADDSVSDPGEVLAVTFTRKATGELRERVLTQLEAARRAAPPIENEFDRGTRELAAAVLRRDAALGWRLLESPGQLRIQTIDSVCAEIARSLPILSGGGGRLRTVEDAGPLYREAAHRAFLHLGGEDESLNQALRTLLLHRDGSLADCERLLAEMLGLRDQWGTLVPLTGPALTDTELDANVLSKLERALDQAICAGLQQLARSIPPEILDALTGIASELGHMAGYGGNASPFALCANLSNAPGETVDHLDHWKALIHLLATKSNGLRSEIGINKKSIGVADYNRKHRYHNRLGDILKALGDRGDLLAAFAKVRNLPPAKYPPEQWLVAKALFRILHRALVELQLVFARRGECDFTEPALLARAALRRDTEGDDLAAALGLRLQHLLVDEMQDTSTSQYDLIELLTQGWDGQSQTVFLVGDPKQSIYLFRQARVERFVRTMRTGKLGDFAVGTLRLTANFRSQRALVDDANADFAQLFPRETTPLHPEDVPFVAATPVRHASSTSSRAWETTVLAAGATADVRQRQTKADAATVRRIVEAWRARPLAAGRSKPWSIAVLVRAKDHLAAIIAEFRKDDGGGPIPFHAVDIDPLGERREILDLLALTRALLHPADRVAWLAVLRAPWCGLTLADLHAVAAGDDADRAEALLPALIEERRDLVSIDGRQRLDRLRTTMSAASAQRGRLPLAEWVDRTWRALGGNLYLGEDELANTARFFPLLDELEHGGSDLGTSIEHRLKTLYAETAAVPGAVDLLTIHKGKGLEWDVVLVPALERKGRSNRAALLTWAELDSADPESAHVVLAPIAGRGQAARELNQWLQGLEAAREAAERKRLLYVACTRAREELHLFAAPVASAKNEVNPAPGSLLQAAWPAAERHFAPPAATPFPMRLEPASFALAASGETLSEPVLPPRLHRLPSGFDAEARFGAVLPLHPTAEPVPSASAPLDRPEGSFAARALGNTVHTFVEDLAHRLAAGSDAATLLAELPRWMPRVAGVLRAQGLPPAQTERLAERTLAALHHILTDETGRWVLAAHPEAATESSRTAWSDRSNSLRTVRVDRLFRAGPEPLVPGDSYLWIVDFKTSTHGREGLEAFLAQQRAQYERQMLTYAATFAPLASVRLLLYYPLIPAHIWWATEAAKSREEAMSS